MTAQKDKIPCGTMKNLSQARQKGRNLDQFVVEYEISGFVTVLAHKGEVFYYGCFVQEIIQTVNRQRYEEERFQGADRH